jgi:hypothetical protein
MCDEETPNSREILSDDVIFSEYKQAFINRSISQTADQLRIWIASVLLDIVCERHSPVTPDGDLKIISKYLHNLEVAQLNNTFNRQHITTKGKDFLMAVAQEKFYGK